LSHSNWSEYSFLCISGLNSLSSSTMYPDLFCSFSNRIILFPSLFFSPVTMSIPFSFRLGMISLIFEVSLFEALGHKLLLFNSGFVWSIISVSTLWSLVGAPSHTKPWSFSFIKRSIDSATGDDSITSSFWSNLLSSYESMNLFSG
jgi:hypothetical protein